MKPRFVFEFNFMQDYDGEVPDGMDEDELLYKNSYSSFIIVDGEDKMKKLVSGWNSVDSRDDMPGVLEFESFIGQVAEDSEDNFNAVHDVGFSVLNEMLNFGYNTYEADHKTAMEIMFFFKKAFEERVGEELPLYMLKNEDKDNLLADYNQSEENYFKFTDILLSSNLQYKPNSNVRPKKI